MSATFPHALRRKPLSSQAFCPCHVTHTRTMPLTARAQKVHEIIMFHLISALLVLIKVLLCLSIRASPAPSASLYRVGVKALGLGFEEIDGFFDEWIGPVDLVGAAHAEESRSPHRKFCFQNPDKRAYNRLEEGKKKIENSQPRLDTEDEMRALHERFGSAEALAGEGAFSGDGLWTWRPAAHFSSRGSKTSRLSFRAKLLEMMRDALGEDYEGARPSGTYWYPPGGVREWHTNKFDVQNGDAQPYRLYFVKLKRESRRRPCCRAANAVCLACASAQSPREYCSTHPGTLGCSEAIANAATASSAMHLLEEEGCGFNEQQAAAVGAEKIKGTEVWRLPDLDGHATLFKLPEVWHCVLGADEEELTHRYSLGFALSEREAMAIVRRGESGRLESKKEEL